MGACVYKWLEISKEEDVNNKKSNEIIQKLYNYVLVII